MRESDNQNFQKETIGDEHLLEYLRGQFVVALVPYFIDWSNMGGNFRFAKRIQLQTMGNYVLDVL